MRFFEFHDINLSYPKPATYNKRVPATPIAEPIKRERLVRNLTAQITRAANTPVPTQDDIKIAIGRFEMSQKRRNLEFHERQRLAQLRQDSKKRVEAKRRRESATNEDC